MVSFPMFVAKYFTEFSTKPPTESTYTTSIKLSTQNTILLIPVIVFEWKIKGLSFFLSHDFIRTTTLFGTSKLPFFVCTSDENTTDGPEIKVQSC